ncbi:MAG: prepilin-type N-terminal cleavage/methylation domain-containing protein [Ignavibacteriae bacterium]|nr:prepilin-type N-terminal cleavage/methylation domain-containing protein [Ignavibacteriota bacterium]
MNNQSGFSLMETLVSMVILGLLVAFTLMLFNNIYSNPKLLLRSEVLSLSTLFEHTKKSLK